MTTMGGVLGTLLYLYCRSGCQATIVASYLAFHPPDSTYEIATEGDKLRIILNQDVLGKDCEALPDYPTVHVVTTKKKTRIPLLCFKQQDAKFTIIFSHGNASDLGIMFAFLAGIAETLGVNVVAYDYTGYGSGPDAHVQTTEQQTYHDIEAVYAWTVTSGLVTDPAQQIILYGQSVGSGPSCYLGCRYPVAGLVLHSPILSGIRVLTSSRLLCCCDIFPNIDRAPLLTAPVLVMHGQEDREVAFSHGRGLHEAVPSDLRTEPWWVPRRGHNDLLRGNEEEFLRRLAAFLAAIQARVARTAGSEPSVTRAKLLAMQQRNLRQLVL